ncbi:MAG: hypothetical protein HY911_12265 [Desulfobacterales bacterium]|nr:hypothetical protein [Desulfobacterales bacterium]
MRTISAKRFLRTAGCIIALLVCTSVWADGPQKLSLDLSMPISLSYLIEYRQFNAERLVLVYGSRPAHDQPGKDIQVYGKKKSAADWLLVDGPTAIWVTGLAGPGHRVPLMLRARLEEQGGTLGLRGYQLIKVGVKEEKRVVLHPGEYLYYDLPGSKSSSSHVELSASSVLIVHLDPFSGVILQAVTPGTTRMRIYTQWWQDAAAQFLAEYEIAVE